MSAWIDEPLGQSNSVTFFGSGPYSPSPARPGLLPSARGAKPCEGKAGLGALFHPQLSLWAPPTSYRSLPKIGLVSTLNRILASG